MRLGSRALLLAAGILAFGAVAVGVLYLGLRPPDLDAEVVGPPARPQSAAGWVPPAPVATAARAAPPAVPRPAVTPVPEEFRARALEQVSASLQADRSKYVERCWTPAIHLDPTTTSVEYELRVTFDGSGRERAREATIRAERRAPSASDPDPVPGDPYEQLTTDIQRCLNGLDLPLSIPAPGRDLVVVVPIRLP